MGNRRSTPDLVGRAAALWFLALTSFSGPTSTHASAVNGAATRVPVWVDTDAACGESFTHDVDDCLALLQAFNSPELEIVGIGTVSGNGDRDTASLIARNLVRKSGCARFSRLCPSMVYSGARSLDNGFVWTPAAEALHAILVRRRATILALGPLTNVATLLVHHPDLRQRIVAIVAVAGRRPGQRFQPTSSRPFTLADRNFEADPVSFDVVLRSGVPLTLTSYEVASKIMLDERDLDRLFEGAPASR